MTVEFLPIGSVIQVLLIALGVTYVITGSLIGYGIRLFWCLLCYGRFLRPAWYMVQCPSCNAWWTGAATALFFNLPLLNAIQMAFTSCGIMAILQFHLGGDGIAANENMEEILKEVFDGREKAK